MKIRSSIILAASVSLISSCVPPDGGMMPQPPISQPINPGPMVGGYSNMTVVDGVASDALDLAQDKVRSQFGVGTTVNSAESQIVAGTNYRFSLSSKSDGRRFTVIVYKPLGGSLRVTEVQVF
jgi:hypothetical protein